MVVEVRPESVELGAGQTDRLGETVTAQGKRL